MGGLETAILLVEDESIVALDIKGSLSSLGFNVVGHVRSGEAAITLADEARPDLILMDIQIAGDTDGIDTARIIAEQFDIPSVFLTAYSDRESIERAKQSHGYGYLLKPFQERELTIAIEMALFKHDAERELRTNRAILDSTVNTIDEGVITTDRDNMIIVFNRAAERLTGWSAEAVCGKTLTEILREQEIKPASPTEKINGYLAGDAAIVRRDGSSFPAEIDRIPICARGGEDGSSVVVIRDITARLEYQQKLIDARIAAESAVRAKSEFIARMSHELRTPLNTILGMTRLVMDSSVEQTDREHLRVAHASAREMIRMVTDLLDFTTYEEKPIELHHDCFSLRDLLDSTVQAHAIDASERGIRLAVIHDPMAINRLRGDRQRLGQVISNLVSNAIKFTPTGWVAVETRTSKAENGIEVEVLVEDTGVGIPKEKREEVFTEFMQLEETRTRSAGGVGIGLAIARRFARAMHGDIRLEPRTGKGTRALCTVLLEPEDGLEDEHREVRNEDVPIMAASDPLLRRVFAPWIDGTRDLFPTLDQPLPDEAVVLMNPDEYRRDAERCGNRTVIIACPIGSESLLHREDGKDRHFFVEEPISVSRVFAVVAKAASSAIPSERGDVSPVLSELWRLLQNGSSQQALEFTRTRRSQMRDEEESEILFRVSLALRKMDIAGARDMLARALLRRGHRKPGGYE